MSHPRSVYEDGGPEPDVWWLIEDDDPILWSKPRLYEPPSSTPESEDAS